MRHTAMRTSDATRRRRARDGERRGKRGSEPAQLRAPLTCSNGSVTLVLLARLNTVTRLPTGLISELPSGVNTTLPAMAGGKVSASAAASVSINIIC